MTSRGSSCWATTSSGTIKSTGNARAHARRLFGRRQAKRSFTRAQVDAWLTERGVMLAGGDLDESLMAYRRLPEVLAQHDGTVRVLHTLRPIAVAMAGDSEFDPFRD